MSSENENKEKSNEEPLISNEEPPKSNEEPPKSNEEPLKSNGEPLKSSGEPLKSSGEPLKSSGEPLKSSGEPLKSNGEPLKSNGEGEPLKTIEIKPTASMEKKKKFMSKSVIASKSSLKKITESALSTLSDTSSSSLAMKRQSDFDKITRAPKYQNTYRLDSKKPFKPHEVYKILESIVLREASELPHYDTASGSKIVQSIASDVRKSVKALQYDRYKICVFVYLGEKKLQGFQAAFRALWDHQRDGWTTFFHETRTYFISCTCYGLYHD